VSSKRKMLIIGDGAKLTMKRSRRKKSCKKRINGLLLMVRLRLKPNKKKNVSEILITNLNRSKRR
jgi:hypothetical protein